MCQLILSLCTLFFIPHSNLHKCPNAKRGRKMLSLKVDGRGCPLLLHSVQLYRLTARIDVSLPHISRTHFIDQYYITIVIIINICMCIQYCIFARWWRHLAWIHRTYQTLNYAGQIIRIPALIDSLLNMTSRPFCTSHVVRNWKRNFPVVNTPQEYITNKGDKFLDESAQQKQRKLTHTNRRND